jgi:hypothetical protein
MSPGPPKAWFRRGHRCTGEATPRRSAAPGRPPSPAGRHFRPVEAGTSALAHQPSVRETPTCRSRAGAGRSRRTSSPRGVLGKSACEEIEDAQIVRTAPDHKVDEERFDLRGKPKPLARDRVVERLDAEAASGTEELASAPVPHRDGEHAVQPGYAVEAHST